MTIEGMDVILDQVAFGYGATSFRFDCDFPAGTVTAVMGPSGSGKSTLLSLVAGFEVPVSGRILADGRDITRLAPAERPVSMVFQENNLFGHLTVEQNVGLGLSPALRLTPADRDAVRTALDRTGLSAMASRRPSELSGGERQRVALARSAVRDRPVLLLDEPFASLGPALRAEMSALLSEVQSRRSMTVMFVTHHPEDARQVADRVVFIEAGQVAASGPATEFFAGAGPAAFRRYIGDRGGRIT